MTREVFMGKTEVSNEMTFQCVLLCHFPPAVIGTPDVNQRWLVWFIQGCHFGMPVYWGTGGQMKFRLYARDCLKFWTAKSQLNRKKTEDRGNAYEEWESNGLMNLRFQCEHLKSIMGVNERVSLKDEKFGVLCEFIYQS